MAERGIETLEISTEVIETGTGRGTPAEETIEIETGRDESPVRGPPGATVTAGGTWIGVGMGTGGNGHILASGGTSTKAISGGE